MMKRPRAGFTLMELLVIVALVVGLAGLLFPVLARVRERSRQATCLSHLRQISQAHWLYLQDWDEQFTGWWQKGPPRPEPFGAYVFWPELLQPYLSGVALFHDPGFRWPEPRPPGLKLADYALLTRGPGGMGTAAAPYWRWAGPAMFLSQVARPSETIQMSDGYTTTKDTRGLVERHSGGMNASYLDGHARWMTRSQAFEVSFDENGDYYHPRRFFHRYIAADR